MHGTSGALLRISATVGVVATIVVLAVGCASAEPGFSSVEAMPLPAGSQPADYITYNATSCASMTNCTAVGARFQSVGGPVAVTESSGTWGTPVEIAMPTGAIGTQPRLTSVSCPSVGDCAAVGYYKTSSSSSKPLLVAESSGTWGAATSPTLPASALTGSTQLATLAGVWCASAGSCVAIGSYSGSGATKLMMAAVETAGTWSALSELPAVPGATAANYISSTGIACTSMGNCAAVAWIGASYAWTETAGVWGAPTLIAPDTRFFPSDVACPSSTVCIAVGEDGGRAAAITETSGTWGTPYVFPQPDVSPATNVAQLSSIACQPTICMTVGIAADLAAYGAYFPQYPAAATWFEGTWSPMALEQSVPAGSAASNESSLDGIACPSVTTCLAVGGAGVSPPPPSNGPTANYPFSTVLTPVRSVVAPGAPGNVDGTPILHGASVSFQVPATTVAHRSRPIPRRPIPAAQRVRPSAAPTA